ncbi:sensor histidine kinase [Nocardioides dubius]|uniref:Histidine kinase/HSP90-like ATPase domain-containing protein n=1 Tax=Nocardioides dubius TaxID=317019 RepID=A0ABN1TNZ8_9ACTN
MDERTRYASVTAGARVFALVMLALPVAVSGDLAPIFAVVILAAVWLVVVFLEGMSRFPVMPALVVEASIVTLLAAATLSVSAVLLPALAVPLFIAGLVRGARGLLEVLGAVVVVLIAAIAPNDSVTLDVALVSTIFTWLMVAVGTGAIGAVVHSLRGEHQTTARSYREARHLLTQLTDLSGELVDGLNPVSIAQNIIDLTREELPISGAVVYTGADYGVVPLLEGDVLVSDEALTSELVHEALDGQGPVVRDGDVAFPLIAEGRVVGVVAATLHPAFARSRNATLATLRDLIPRLASEAVQLDTALLFASIQADATAEERQRLARDLHDGVAQDLAAFGYLIDGIEDARSPQEQAEMVTELREELTRVVAELRRSIFGLRNEAMSAFSLGESVRAMAEHIESRAGIPVEVSLDESGSRLRADIEAELLRIVQEGMNNAVKHARASRIRVACSVHPPYARLRVIDNGRGLQAGRTDSHGLRIMRERARRIGAHLDLRSTDGRAGTELLVELNAGAKPAPLPSETAL